MRPGNQRTKTRSKNELVHLCRKYVESVRARVKNSEKNSNYEK
jgi:hypothetical protein